MLQFLKKVWNWLTADSNSQTKINGNIISGKGGTIRVGPGGSVNGLSVGGDFSKEESFTITRSKDSNSLCVECSVDDTGKVLTFVILGDGTGSFGQLFTFSGTIEARFTIKQVPSGHIIKGTVKVSRGGSFNFNRDYLTGCGCTYDSSKLKTSGGVTFN